MFRVDTPTASATLPTPSAPGAAGYFKTGSNATVPGKDWFNSVQEEFMSILAAAGTTPSKTTYNQVLTSLQALFISTGNTRLANALQAPSNLSDVANPATALTNLGGVPSTRTITAGTGLTGGGALSANRTIAVVFGTDDGTVAQGSDARIVGAVQAANNLNDVANPATSLTNLGGVPSTRTITAGTGLTGGGSLAANRSLAVSYGTTAGTAAQGNDTRIINALQSSQNLNDVANPATALSNIGGVPNTRTITAGTGLSGGGNLAANRSLSVVYGVAAHTACQGNDARLETRAVDNSNTWGPGGTVSFAHGLSTVHEVQVWMRCVSGEFGYGVGTSVLVAQGSDNGGGGSVFFNSANAGIVISNDGLEVFNGGTNDPVFVTPNKWVIDLVAKGYD